MPEQGGVSSHAGAPPEFVAACERAGVAGDLRAALWRVHVTTVPASRDVPALMRDHALWETFLASRRGDVEAASRFERHWARAIAGFCRGRGDAGHEKELASLFFERVYRLVPGSFHWQCAFSAYLGSIMINAASDLRAARARRSARDVSIDQPGLDLRASQPSPEAGALAVAEADALRRALWTLAPMDRHVVVACLVDGESGDVVAERLGVSRDAVYQRLHRARLALRKELKAWRSASERRPRKGGSR